jgi:hypothetical protein
MWAPGPAAPSCPPTRPLAIVCPGPAVWRWAVGPRQARGLWERIRGPGPAFPLLHKLLIKDIPGMTRGWRAGYVPHATSAHSCLPPYQPTHWSACPAHNSAPVGWPLVEWWKVETQQSHQTRRVGPMLQDPAGLLKLLPGTRTSVTSQASSQWHCREATATGPGANSTSAAAP